MIWAQVYDPLNNAVLSTLCAAIPVVVLLGGLAFLRWSAHVAAFWGLVSALAVAVLVFDMCHRPPYWSHLLIGILEPGDDRHIGATS